VILNSYEGGTRKKSLTEQLIAKMEDSCRHLQQPQIKRGRLRWFGHVECKGEVIGIKQCISTKPEGTRQSGQSI